MASTELLASKIVILEEEPSIPAITALPSAVCLCLGITERGPIADRTLLTSFEEYVRYFGGFGLNYDAAIAAYGFFHNGGSFMWVSRTCHFTDLTDPSTYTAAKGSVMLQTAGTGDQPAVIPGTNPEPFILRNTWSLFLEEDGVPLAPVGFYAMPASEISAPVFPTPPAVGGETMGVTVKGAYGDQEQTVTAVGGESTALDWVNLLNSQLAGLKVRESGPGTNIEVETDWWGTGAEYEITTPGTLMAIVGLTAGPHTGPGAPANMYNQDDVQGSEVEAAVEAAHASIDVVVRPTGEVDLKTVGLGAGKTLQIVAPTNPELVAALGWDTNLHTGSDDAPEDTLLVEGKTPGAYTDDITIRVTTASSQAADEFNLQVLVSGNVKEAFPNLTMGDGVTPDYSMANYVETVINDVNLGSNLIKVTDQLLAYTATLKRPADGTSAALTGGDDGLAGLADADFLGNQAGPTGLYAFDQVTSGRILIIPGQYTPAILLGQIDYAETHRNGSMFCVLDCPAGYTAAQMVSWMDSSGLTEYSEFAAIYWPRIQVANPSTTVFGTDSSITVANSGWVAGKYARNDQNLGGVYEQPAGIGGGYGIIRGMTGVEPDPSGRSEHEVLDETKRDLIAPKRINPITRLDGTPWHIDGGDTLKSTGNFPHIGERRGVIFIEQTIKSGLVVLKHRFNNKENRRLAGRIVTAFLLREMRKGAFRSEDPATAFYVDVSDALNPLSEVFAGKMHLRIGLATNKPAKYIIVLVTQDTRALQEELAAA